MIDELFLKSLPSISMVSLHYGTLFIDKKSIISQRSLSIAFDALILQFKANAMDTFNHI
jgi:hypothetical protein